MDNLRNVSAYLSREPFNVRNLADHSVPYCYIGPATH